MPNWKPSEQADPCPSIGPDGQPCRKTNGHRELHRRGEDKYHSNMGVAWHGGIAPAPPVVVDLEALEMAKWNRRSTDDGYRTEADYQTWDRPPMSMRG